jgi:hypothetical protein
MKNRLLQLLFWCFLVFLVIGLGIPVKNAWDKKAQEPDTMEITGVVRVFYHTGNQYSVMHKGNDGEILTTSWNKPTRIIADVPADKLMWASKYLGGQNFGGSWNKYCVIHIHAVNEINGAGWDNGKLGKGTTELIE